jgi:tetratricopeptide (TPR) repeat protein
MHQITTVHGSETTMSSPKHQSSLLAREELSSQYAKVIYLPDTERKARVLNAIGCLYHQHYRNSGAKTDLDEAIRILEQVVDISCFYSELGEYSYELADALNDRFRQNGAHTDKERAIKHCQDAVFLSSGEGSKDAETLSLLGQCLELRYELLGAEEDWDRAIILYTKAVEMTSPENLERLDRYNRLGVTLMKRFERFGRREDLETAISVLQKAAELTPDDHPNKPSRLSNLGGALFRRFERFGRLEDVETATSVYQKAAELMPDDHPDKPSRLSNLGNALLGRFERFGRLEDVETAISVYQKAAELTPDDHPNKPSLLNNLGHAHLIHSRHLPDPNHLKHAHLYFSEAANSPLGPPHHLFKAARNWAKCETLLSRSPLLAFSRALQLLPRIAWLGLSFTDQHALLAQVGDVVREAVTAAIQHDEYEMAVEWIEQGRSIVWQNLLNLRTPVDQLAESHPDLADRLRTISRQLETSTSHDSGFNQTDKLGIDEVARKHRELSIERDKLIDTIRAIPEYKSFMSPKRFDELAPVAHEGPVVILNVQESRCDALVLISSDADVSAVVIPLEQFSYDMSKKLSEALKSLLLSCGVRSRNLLRAIRDGADEHDVTFKNILSILWRHVVKPVIDGLAYQVSSVQY